MLKDTVYPNNTKEQYSYNSIYNLINLKTADINLNYTYDKSSLITSKNDVSYEYDKEARLIKAGSDSFIYDKAGNILNNNAKYDTKTNRLLSNDRYDITYDSSGNIKTKYDKINKTTSYYTFDARNRLIKYEKQDENNNTITLITYEYDPLGRRISKTTNGQKEYYVYNENDIIAVLDSNKNEKAYITHYDSIDTPLSITTSEGTYYYHRDHQGSILALTDQDGNVVETFTYDNHYGRIIKHTKTTETNNPYTYTGREYDTDELYYYRARYYDPTIQRFISEDPIGFASGDFNFYRYVWNNPVNFVDPSGEFSMDCYAQCIEQRRWDLWKWVFPVALSPKRVLSPFRVPKSNQPWTTIPSVIDHYIGRRSMRVFMRKIPGCSKSRNSSYYCGWST